MRFLVVDDERSFASLLKRALKRLGHEAVVESDPRAALDRFCDSEFDGVITDIDMPVMNGVELAVAMREVHSDVPIAFCRGMISDSAVLEAAEAIGSIMPRVWTVADVKRVVEDMRGSRPRLAKGSQSSITPPPEALADSSAADTVEQPQGEEPGEAEERPDQPSPAPGKRLPRVRTNPTSAAGFKRRLLVTCKTWEQVEKLCDEHGSGRKPLTIKGGYELLRGEHLTIALGLPDELVLSIAADVVAANTDPADGVRVFGVLLTGLSPEVCARLRAMCQEAGGGSKRTGAYVQVTKRGTPAPERASSPSGKVLGNLQLKKRSPSGGWKN
jgi:CheY-like chemotaxis protein